VAQALDRAIKEILPPVISRSVTIALITTKELVLKDFALEPDEKKLIRGATLIVQNLAGNLALVTCREPLKIAFQQTLKAILDQVALEEKTKEEVIHTTSVDNLDLGCALIKKAVIEKALEDVNQDPVLVDAIEKRRMARENGIPYYDETVIKIYESLPVPLRPTLGGLSKDQMRIYEEFGKLAKSQEPKELKKGGLKAEGRPDKRLDSESIAIIQRFEQCKY
jgi:CCR4-NOT transcription complex subunit 1